MKRQRAVIGIVGMGLAVLPVAAADKEPAVVGEDMVVTATRDERPEYEIPANTTVLTADDIRKAGYTSASDALENMGGVYVRSVTGNPATTEVGMRGFGENSHGRVLILLDGRRLNRPDMSTIDWLQIPLNNIERIEVVRGSGSVLYGDNAVAGVINIITRKGEKAPALDVSAQAGSYGMNVFRAGAGASQSNMAYSVNAERYQTDGYRERSGFLSWGGGGSFGYEVNKALNVSLGLSYESVDYDIPGWLTKEQMRDDPRRSVNPADSSENEYVSVTAGVELKPDQGHKAAAGFLFARKDMRSDMASWSSFADLTIDTIGVTPRYVLASEPAGHNNNLVAGIDYYRDALDVERFPDAGRSLVTTKAAVTKDTLGFYLRDELGLTDSLTLGAGGRTEFATIGGKVTSSGTEEFDADKTHHVNAFDISLIRTFENKSKVFGRWGTVYRYPFVDEQVNYIGFGADSFNPDLDPEEGWSLEAGTEIRMPEGIRLGVTLFWMEMKDEIAWNYVTMQNENMDATRHQGAETEASYALSDQLKIFGNYTFTDAVFREGANKDNNIPLVPKHKGTAGVTAELPMQFSTGLSATYVGECYLGGDNGNIRERLADHVVMDMIVRHSLKTVPGLEMFVAVDNLLDEKYAELGYVGLLSDAYYPAPGRCYRGGVSYRF